MRNNNKNFPYPVLSKDNKDIINSILDFYYTPLESKNLKLKVQIKLKNKKIEELIKNKLAIFVVHIECSKTRFRTIEKSYDTDFVIEIPKDYLLNSVEISSMILTTKDIFNYKNEDFSEDFSGESFDITKNKILGYDDDIKIEIEKTSDHLENFPSIFTIVKNNNMEKKIEMDLDYTGDKIKIILNTNNFEIYKNLRQDQQLEKVLASLFILPALVQILADYKNLDDLSELNWYHVIKLRLSELKLEDEEEISTNPLKISQLILGDTFKNSLETLLERSIGDEENE